MVLEDLFTIGIAWLEVKKAYLLRFGLRPLFGIW